MIVFETEEHKLAVLLRGVDLLISKARQRIETSWYNTGIRRCSVLCSKVRYSIYNHPTPEINREE